MNISHYKTMISQMFSSKLVCRCCGANTCLIFDAAESICSFCEAYVTIVDRQIIHGNLEMERNLIGMQIAIAAGRWEEGIVFADALAATKDPYLLYGASSFYRYYSDYVYHDVDYTQGGFMYSNAAKRSDEPLKNKHNAMALLSKSKDCLFRVTKMVADNQAPDNMLRFISFMANIKLGRHAQAKKLLNLITTVPSPEIIRTYMNMVYDVETHSKDAHTHIAASLGYGVSNSIYYMSKYLATHRQLDDALALLDYFAPKTNLAQAYYYRNWLRNVSSASGF